jgi:glycogen phosphorylase
MVIAQPTGQDIPSPSSFGDAPRTGLTADDLRDGITEHLFFTLGRSAATATPHDLYMALSHAVRDRLMSRHLAYKDVLRNQHPKAVAYLSAEFLLGPQLGNNLLMLGIRQEAQEAVQHFGINNLDSLLAIEEEPGLGNGGLGRLAACYMESLATLEMPATGYGIRYEFGIFDQVIHNGWQVEVTDQWLKGGWPWELVHPDKGVRVGFGGRVEAYTDAAGRYHSRWLPSEFALGIPHDVPVLGYRVNTCARLRLWRAASSQSLDLSDFNRGNFSGAVYDEVSSQTITKVLYPNDSTEAGRRLRLKQQIFFVSCSLQDMLRNLSKRGLPLRDFADHWAVQLNDTHPAIAVAELMRLLIDEHDFSWDEAWSITTRSIAYTNHTLLPEALECWDLQLFGSLLPRHLEIIFEINWRFLNQVRLSSPGDEAKLRRMSIIGEDGNRTVRMAHLAVVASHHVNGVAALHSELVRTSLLADFAQLWPEKFCNVTNGVTPRRWLALANPPLAALLDETLGVGWLVQPERWQELERWAEDPAFLERWAACRLEAKRRLSDRIGSLCDTIVDPLSLFDVQVKRIHEYKRQHLNALQVICRYLRIKNGDTANMVPRTVVFGGKAAAGYFMAKLIIRFIHAIADVVNQDPQTRELLRVVFLPDYNVKLSEGVYPAADLSEQISTAGLEASGTGNMKFAMNGAVTIGTLDGANVEIIERVGQENFVLFGHTTEQIQELRMHYHPWEWLHRIPLLQEAFLLVQSGHFSNGDRDMFQPLVQQLMSSDPFFLLADFEAYSEAQNRVDEAWREPGRWQRMGLLNMARSGFFSSDRAIRTYADQIWSLQAAPVEMTCPLSVPTP